MRRMSSDDGAKRKRRRLSPPSALFHDTGERGPLKLADIRGELIRLEETIIFAMIERAQFARNAKIYVRNDSPDFAFASSSGSSPSPGAANGAKQLLRPFWSSDVSSTSGKEPPRSFLEHFLLESEKTCARLGRYTSPDEHAFFPGDLPPSLVPQQSYPTPIRPNTININHEIYRIYVEGIVPAVTDDVDDGQYGSSAQLDIDLLRALSKRIHYGMFVAEAKFCAQTDAFSRLIEAGDASGLMNLLTNKVVEDKVVARVLHKAKRYGTDVQISDATSKSVCKPSYKLNPDEIASLYREFLIPLNKRVQVDYLLRRLDRPAYAHLEGETHRGAAAKLFGEESQGVACSSIASVAETILRGEANYGIVPTESASEGLLRAAKRVLSSSPLWICDEFKTPQWRYFVVRGRRQEGDALSSEKDAPVSSALCKSRGVLFFVVKHEPGSLRRALNAIPESVNLRALESMPVQGSEWQYCFYAELEGLERGALDAVAKKLGEHTTFVRVAGSFVAKF